MNLDELLLVENKASPKSTLPDLRGPTAQEIYEATKDMEMRNADKVTVETSVAEANSDVIMLRETFYVSCNFNQPLQ